jgi:glycosyltransferase involved in cell wall biosynthesis
MSLDEVNMPSSEGIEKIQQVLDTSHEFWVQGGVFTDLRRSSNLFTENPIYVPAPNSARNIFNWFIQCIKIRKFDRVLFSSLTPLENYDRFPFKKKKQRTGLWYTHKDGDFSRLEKRSLQSASVIFTHSTFEWEKIDGITSTKKVEMLAAIDSQRFFRRAKIENCIAWVGTSVERKRPKLFLDFVDTSPKQKFKLFGHNWLCGPYSERIETTANLEIFELNGPMDSEKFDGCDIYLMTSRIEGGPMPLLEAIAAGIVPICTNTGFVKSIFELIDLPAQLFIEPNIKSISRAIDWVRSEGFKITETQREKILSLDFQRLATIIDKSI